MQPSCSDPREVAFAAQLRDRQRLSAPDRFLQYPAADGARQDNMCRDIRIDPRQGNVLSDSNRDVRQDVYGALGQPCKAEPPSQATTLEDLQRTIASL
jgi:hypothetical protein